MSKQSPAGSNCKFYNGIKSIGRINEAKGIILNTNYVVRRASAAIRMTTERIFEGQLPI